jgi:hypothetical protein
VPEGSCWNRELRWGGISGRHPDWFFGVIIERWPDGRFLAWRPVDSRGEAFALEKVQHMLRLQQRKRWDGSRMTLAEGTLRIEGENAVARSTWFAVFDV